MTAGLTGAAMLLLVISGGTIRSVINGADEASEFIEQTAKHGDELEQGLRRQRLSEQNFPAQLLQRQNYSMSLGMLLISE